MHHPYVGRCAGHTGSLVRFGDVQTFRTGRLFRWGRLPPLKVSRSARKFERVSETILRRRSSEALPRRKPAAFSSWSAEKTEHVDQWHEVLNCFCEEPLLVGADWAGGGLEAGLESTHCGPYHGLFLEHGSWCSDRAWKSRRS